MHIPDGFLTPQVWAPLGVASASAVAYAARRAKHDLPPEKVPLVGAMAAFIFAAQMVNFRVAAGTSGHLVGAVLAAALLGPYGAVVAMTVVLVVQCLVFQDGGVTALGANVLNMALVGAWLGWPMAAGLARLTRSRALRLTAVGLGAAVAVVLGAALCSAELALSGTVPWRVVLPVMVGVHVLIGLGEAVLTVLALALISSWRPDLVPLLASAE
ncbi:MAG: energy-coupling factor ABC transporter permease, partial [Armatimonadetes bacterium]|nr:energy-coupling factor ABC transporter permease [Armatimonadota bacterium]